MNNNNLKRDNDHLP